MKFEPVPHLSDAEIEELNRMCQPAWWAKGRTVTGASVRLDNSEIIVGLRETEGGRPVAFARVLTDLVSKALVTDFIVSNGFDDAKMARELMDAICEHPALAEVREIELYCPNEMVAMYREWGFTEEPAGLRFMRRTRAKAVARGA